MVDFSSRFALAALTFGSLTLIACQVGAPTLSDDGSNQRNIVDRSIESPPMQRASDSAYAVAARVEMPGAEPEDHDALHNVFELSENIVSGSEPRGAEAFRILRDKGVRTILSVDGKVPDAELAAEFGMKYVHVPIQYRGITQEEVSKITKTFREQEGPFFVHCFHGKHRGPAAAALGRLVLDGVSRETAIGEMQQWCGTSESYEGLYSTVAYTTLPSEGETQALDWDFPAAEPLEGVAGAMVVISRPYDHLKAAAKNGWQPDPGHPDLNPFNEATKLMGHLERTAAMTEVVEHDADFRRLMVEATEHTSTLRRLIGALDAGETEAQDVDQVFTKLAQTCSACHNAYRN